MLVIYWFDSDQFLDTVHFFNNVHLNLYPVCVVGQVINVLLFPRRGQEWQFHFYLSGRGVLMMEGGQMKGQWFSRCHHVTGLSRYMHGCSTVLWNATMSRMTGCGSVSGKSSTARGRGAGTKRRPRLTAQSSDCPTDSHLQVSSRLRCPSSCQHISGAPACEAASSDPFWKLFDIDCVCFLHKSISVFLFILALVLTFWCFSVVVSLSCFARSHHSVAHWIQPVL